MSVELVVGLRLRIVDAPSGLFDEGDELEVVAVCDGVLVYRVIGGDRAEFFDGGECSLSAFGDGSLTWEIIGSV